ncbi:MAG TPA: tyrosine--tRNA ligase [Flavobacteriales bacterium]|jgi:tyrosyl-tRNA synthetase|nr:tyrosine--tRNA ligase [Flavobacteriales bacterium]
MNLIEELEWRGLIHDVIPGTQEQLEKEQTTGYVGFDPTAPSLHIGNLVPVVLLKHLQRAGHKPIVLMGGATGRVGDPSGKDKERQLLDAEVIESNVLTQTAQLQKFIDFENTDNGAILVNNYDWFKDMNFLDFIRETGKHITINYMMAKDSVKNRLEGGMSFTEFSYQLVQGYDFLKLYVDYDCKLQMGGSDQWGNITTGTELIRRKAGGEAFALTAPLIKKADGSKFGKSEGGNVWLSSELTTPYEFYQYWLNTSDEDAENYIKVFTFLSRSEIEEIVENHNKEPHLRKLQKRLAEEVTKLVHSEKALNVARASTELLFGRGSVSMLHGMEDDEILSVFDGVPQANLNDAVGMGIADLLHESGFLASKGEARRALKENSISVNKEKVNEAFVLEEKALINQKYVLLQHGKKKFFLLSTIPG